jgi:hypothetical protein
VRDALHAVFKLHKTKGEVMIKCIRPPPARPDGRPVTLSSATLDVSAIAVNRADEKSKSSVPVSGGGGGGDGTAKHASLPATLADLEMGALHAEGRGRTRSLGNTSGERALMQRTHRGLRRNSILDKVPTGQEILQVKVQCENSGGLLPKLIHKLVELHLDIVGCEVQQEGNRSVDVFYVKDTDAIVRALSVLEQTAAHKHERPKSRTRRHSLMAAVSNTSILHIAQSPLHHWEAKRAHQVRARRRSVTISEGDTAIAKRRRSSNPLRGSSRDEHDDQRTITGGKNAIGQLIWRKNRMKSVADALTEVCRVFDEDCIIRVRKAHMCRASTANRVSTAEMFSDKDGGGDTTGKDGGPTLEEMLASDKDVQVVFEEEGDEEGDEGRAPGDGAAKDTATETETTTVSPREHRRRSSLSLHAAVTHELSMR